MSRQIHVSDCDLTSELITDQVLPFQLTKHLKLLYALLYIINQGYKQRFGNQFRYYPPIWQIYKHQVWMSNGSVLAKCFYGEHAWIAALWVRLNQCNIECKISCVYLLIGSCCLYASVDVGCHSFLINGKQK